MVEHNKSEQAASQGALMPGNTLELGARGRTAAQRFSRAVRGPVLGLVVNLVLVAVKGVAGIASGSAALLADAGHSGADVANNLLVLGSLIYARRPADETHPYGHDRAEVLAALVSTFILLAAALFFGWESLQKLIAGEPTPTLLALWVAIGSIAVKLVVVRVEARIARDVTSLAVRADARDSLSDVLSSIAVVVGVLGAHFGVPRLDGVAGLVIALLILMTAIQIGGEASHELLEHNLNPKVLDRVRAAALGVDGVVAVRGITGRTHGSDVLVELSIQVDPQATVEQGATIADCVRHAIYEQVPEVGNALVELNTDHIQRLRSQFR
ncbi:MAG TPA: cation diffusion facilitator family transporter [Ktedonobacterales bacterium]|nr:cation diffusion facilitator family transporter [Ktedonobacterales bacterium]